MLNKYEDKKTQLRFADMEVINQQYQLIIFFDLIYFIF